MNWRPHHHENIPICRSIHKAQWNEKGRLGTALRLSNGRCRAIPSQVRTPPRITWLLDHTSVDTERDGSEERSGGAHHSIRNCHKGKADGCTDADNNDGVCRGLLLRYLHERREAEKKEVDAGYQNSCL